MKESERGIKIHLQLTPKATVTVTPKQSNNKFLNREQPLTSSIQLTEASSASVLTSTDDENSAMVSDCTWYNFASFTNNTYPH